MSTYYTVHDNYVYRNADPFGNGKVKALCDVGEKLYLCIDEKMENIFSHGSFEEVTRHFQLISNDVEVKVVDISADETNINLINKALENQLNI